MSLTDGIDSSTAAGRMMIGALGSLAECERELTRERTALKRAASRSSSQPAMITRWPLLPVQTRGTPIYGWSPRSGLLPRVEGVDSAGMARWPTVAPFPEPGARGRTNNPVAIGRL